MSSIITPDNILAALESLESEAAGKRNRLYQYPGQEGENLRSN